MAERRSRRRDGTLVRIAYVSADPGVPIFGTKGCSIHSQEVIRALLNAGAELELFATNLSGPRTLALEPDRVHSLPALPKGEASARERAAIDANGALCSQLEREAPFDAVYERYSLWTFAGMEYARSCGIAGVLEVNAPLIEEQAQYRTLIDRAGAERVARRVFGAASALIAVSEEVAAYLAPHARAGCVHMIPNAVDPERFPAGVRPARPAADGTFTVGFVGSLKPWHGLGVLSEAFAAFRGSHPRARLLIVGDGPAREELLADLRARGVLDAAELTGGVAPSEIPGLLASMDVAVAPYPHRSSFYFSPLKVFEYLAAGVPVVASRVGQLESLLDDGVTGLLCPPSDPSALTAALERLYRHASLRSRMGRAGRAMVLDRFTWRSVASQILELAARGANSADEPRPTV